jgi:hypothetical protein
MLQRALIVVVVVGLAACGGTSTSSPAAPTPTPVVTTVSVTMSPSTDVLKIQGTETFTVTATLSDGTTKAVTGSWSSDNVAVATVDTSGKVTGIASGQATIAVAYDTARATRIVRIIPDYQGNWTGEYAVLSCQDSGDFAKEEWCKTALRNGVIKVTMALTHARDAVTGSWTHDVMSGTTQGTLEADGTLALSGIGTLDRIPMAIAGWRSRSADNKSQTGKFSLTFTSSVWSGSALASVEIRTCTKGT